MNLIGREWEREEDRSQSSKHSEKLGSQGSTETCIQNFWSITFKVENSVAALSFTTLSCKHVHGV